MSGQNRELRVIKIIDPVLCMQCESSYLADTLMSNGRRKKMIYCSRLDCDNWVGEKGDQQLIDIGKLPKY